MYRADFKFKLNTWANQNIRPATEPHAETNKLSGTLFAAVVRLSMRGKRRLVNY